MKKLLSREEIFDLEGKFDIVKGGNKLVNYKSNKELIVDIQKVALRYCKRFFVLVFDLEELFSREIGLVLSLDEVEYNLLKNKRKKVKKLKLIVEQ